MRRWWRPPRLAKNLLHPWTRRLRNVYCGDWCDVQPVLGSEGLHERIEASLADERLGRHATLRARLIRPAGDAATPPHGCGALIPQRRAENTSGG
jgi:hypothetical protein